MGLGIEGIRSVLAPFLNAGQGERQEEIKPEGTAGLRDSYISSAAREDLLCSTGNYDNHGEMDDDFSLKIAEDNDGLFQAAQYSAEYAEQIMKVIAGAESSSSEMNRNPEK